jgi:hypothetical protein
LTNLWGITGDRKIADALVDATSPAEVFALETELGSDHFDAAQSARFDRFIRRFVGNLARRGHKDTELSPFQPPPHLWSFPRGLTYDGQEAVTTVEVYEVTLLYDEQQYGPIRRRLVREIDIPAPAGPPEAP